MGLGMFRPERRKSYNSRLLREVKKKKNEKERKKEKKQPWGNIETANIITRERLSETVFSILRPDTPPAELLYTKTMTGSSAHLPPPPKIF
jgi:hypothetical protein